MWFDHNRYVYFPAWSLFPHPSPNLFHPAKTLRPPSTTMASPATSTLLQLGSPGHYDQNGWHQVMIFYGTIVVPLLFQPYLRMRWIAGLPWLRGITSQVTKENVTRLAPWQIPRIYRRCCNVHCSEEIAHLWLLPVEGLISLYFIIIFMCLDR